MDTLLIKGGTPLSGEIKISGAKNAVLPIMIASLLTDETLTIYGSPYLMDVTNVMQLLAGMGVNLSFNYIDESAISIKNTSKIKNPPTEMVRLMRASILALGPMLARYGQVKLTMPGGCVIGDRPIDVHLKGLEAMGVDFSESHGDWIIGKTKNKRLKAADIHLRTASVTGTENLIMAATLAEGQSILRNTAKEPEIVDLANCLNKMGAKITGHGTSTIKIEGVEKLNGTKYTLMPDRIEAATYLVAAAITRGKIKIHNVVTEHLKQTTDMLTKAGVDIVFGEDFIEVDARGKQLKAIDLKTEPYPGFPTDMQAQFIALNALSQGEGRITEEVFEGRFRHVSELKKMGADLTIENNVVISKGVSELNGTVITASDLRASASLVLAGLVANGETVIHQVHHIDRGYELIEEKFRKLGANIYRLHSAEQPPEIS